MADHGRRRTRRAGREERRASGFLPPLPKDEDWIAELRDDFPDEGGPVLGGGLAGGRSDVGGRTADTADASAADPGAGTETATGGAVWKAVADELDAQRESILALADRLEAVQTSVDELARRVVPASEAVSPPHGGPTVRDVVVALWASAAGSAARLRREVARGHRHGAGRWRR